MAFQFEDTKPNISNEQLLQDLKAVAAKLGGEQLAQRAYRSNGSFSTTAIKSRFGSWNKAVIAAGLRPRELHFIGVEDLFNNLIDVWTRLGRQPRRRELVRPLSRYTHNPYVRQFGSWLKAMRAFVETVGESAAESALPAVDHGVGRGRREPSLRLRFLVMRRDRFKCRFCGRSPATSAGLELHVDHIVPWSAGGSTVIENLQTLCTDCNLGKSNLAGRKGGDIAIRN